jgi:alkylation response protein AidB-like acyl-CoA dehydrogenase
VRKLEREGAPLRPAVLPAGTEPVRREVRDFLREEIASGGFVPTVDCWLSGWDEQFTRRLAGRGWVGMTIPVAYGGHGRSFLERYVVIEELLAAGAPVAAHWVADRQSAPSLLRYGSEEQKQRFLPAISAGECYFAIGMSEPDSGTDLASVRTRAERADGGWKLTGTKVWTSGAHHAHYAIVLARTSPAAGTNARVGLSQFLLDLRGPAVDVRPIRLLTGEHHFNEVILDATFVPDDCVLGEIGAGWAQVTGELAYERSGPERFLSTFPLLPKAVEAVADAVDARGAAGPGSADGDVRAVGALAARAWVLRQMTLSVATSLASGSAPALEAALVKDLATRFETELTETARTATGAIADPGAPEGSLERHLARAVLHGPGFTLRGGTNEILRSVVAKGVAAW